MPGCVGVVVRVIVMLAASSDTAARGGSLARSGGNGWIIMNKYLQVETRDGAVRGDGTFFAVGDCNYGCIGAAVDWDKSGIHPVSKILYPGEEQVIHACLNTNILDKKKCDGCCTPRNLKPAWWP